MANEKVCPACGSAWEMDTDCIMPGSFECECGSIVYADGEILQTTKCKLKQERNEAVGRAEKAEALACKLYEIADLFMPKAPFLCPPEEHKLIIESMAEGKLLYEKIRAKEAIPADNKPADIEHSKLK